jgi:invasion protein IalB
MWLPLAATFLALTLLPAAAQQASGQADGATAAPAAPPGPIPNWIKTCDTDKASKKEICVITQELRTDSGTFIASASIRRIAGDKKYSMLVSVPNGMLIKPGLKAQVDAGDPISLIYVVCEARNCLGIADLDDAFVDSMKSGKAMILTVYNQQAKTVTFSMTLAGFGGALAGKGLDAEGFKKLQEARVAAFKLKADEARDAMVKAQQQQQGGGAAPAPAQ